MSYQYTHAENGIPLLPDFRGRDYWLQQETGHRAHVLGPDHSGFMGTPGKFSRE